jgi:hypothetical protein
MRVFQIWRILNELSEEMRGFRIDFVERSRSPRVWLYLLGSAVFCLWSLNQYVRQEDPKLAADFPPTVVSSSNNYSDGEFQRQGVTAEHLENERIAMIYPWWTVFDQLEGLPVENLSVLHFELDSRHGIGHATVEVGSFSELNAAFGQNHTGVSPSTHWEFRHAAAGSPEGGGKIRVDLEFTPRLAIAN